MQVAEIYDGLRASDEAVAKALGLSEVAQIARTEGRMRQFMLAQWMAYARRAVSRAAALARAGKPAKTISATVRREMRQFPSAVLPRTTKELDKIYRLARTAGWKKATGQTKASLSYDTPNLTEIIKATPKAGFAINPSFTVVDEAAVAALQEQQVFWLGQLYGEQVAEGISTTVSEAMIEAGASRRVAGNLIQERLTEQLGHIRTPGGFHGSAAQYFEGVAANAATHARAFGQLTSMDEVGFTTYYVTNPSDSRTCPVCNHVDGKVFTVSQGKKQMEAVLDADSPDAVKAVHPWLSIKAIEKISPNPGKQSLADSKALAGAGQALPPYHFRCRCAVDVA